MMTLDLGTILIHAVFFFTVLFFFTKFVLTPLVAVRDARVAATQGKEGAAVEWLAEADALEKTYTDRMQRAKIDVQALRDAARDAAGTRAAELLVAARAQAAAKLEQAKVDISRQMESAKQVLSASTNDFAGLIAARLLERDVQLVDEAVISEARLVAGVGKAH